MTICASLRRAAQIRPDRTALVCEGRQISWSTLADRVARAAAGLAKAGVEPADRVAILMGNSVEYIELMAAIPWSGAAAVPLNTRWSRTEWRDALIDCDPKVLISDQSFASQAADLAAELGFQHIVTGTDGAARYEAIIAHSAPMVSQESELDSLYAIFYTGGTTGRSKGVMLSHRAITHTALAAIAEGAFGQDATYMHTSPTFHIAGAWAVVAMIMSGGRGVVLPKFDAQTVISTIARENVTETLLVPAMIQMVVDHPTFSPERFTSIRRILYGASPITEALLSRAASVLPHAHFMQCYGMTETSSQCTVLHHAQLSTEDIQAGRHRSAGRATYGMEVSVFDEQDQPAPVGVVGEIVTRGPGIMTGYWNRPDATDEALRSGWMHTGDGGYRDAEGFIFVVDRIKDMIVSGGENVYSIEVENVLAKHPAVRQCAVFGIPHEKWIEQVHAAIVLHDGHSADKEALMAWCRASLAGFKIPRSYEFLDTLPMSGPGKILKRTLRDPYWKPEAP